MDYNKNFLERYNKLNEAQKLAVDTLEGPVMVIAGPGTGKTEVLGMRIANLLRSDAQIAPHEILCLTYTDEAAHNMRKRLSSIVGLAAQKVNIFTFHGFCNSIIQNHGEYFGYRQSEPISDLEKMELLHQMLDKLPMDHPMYRVGKSTYFDTKNLIDFFGEMKKENWNSQTIKNAAEAHIADLPNQEKYIYKNSRGNNKKGDLKVNEIEKEKEKMQKTCAAADLFDAYNKGLQAMHRYDYADMLLWVIEAFKKGDYLLQHYQERFQYILVDEFQDTNGAQNEILNLLTSYWGEDANIFVVGDDDQSIYEFQGARIHNIAEFYEKYKSKINTIVLTENYRSSPAILAKAMMSIEYNQERLINKLAYLNLDKKISSALPRFKDEVLIPEPKILCYPNPAQEIVGVVNEIEQLLAQGTTPDSIAVLFSQFKIAVPLIDLLERKQIEYQCSRSLNVLEETIPRQISRILQYLDKESKKPYSGEQDLFQLMHSPYFEIAPDDIAVLSLYLSSKEAKEKNIRYWRQLFAHEMILSNLNLRSLKGILNLGRLLDQWIQQMQVLRMPILIEKIVYETGMVNWMLQSEDAAMQTMILQSYFAFVASVCKVDTRISDFLGIIDTMRSENIAVPVSKISKSEKGIKLLTIHSAKGLEFEHVYMIGLNDKYWERKSGGNGRFALPDSLTKSTTSKDESSSEVEVMRRLFFVGITRAKLHLSISFAESDNLGKGMKESCFVSEILGESPLQQKVIDNEILLADVRRMMAPVEPVYIKTLDRALIQNQIENFALSPSSLSKYLRCPITFYYEDILRTPVAENDSMAFGTAIHYALERAFLEMSKHPEKQFPSSEDVVGYFRYKMREKEIAFTPLQYERRLEKGAQVIREYYEHNLGKFSKEVQLEKWLQGNIGNIPIKGKIDKIELLENNTCRVIDYKTGKSNTPRSRENIESPNEKNGMLGGDYWRQMVFYKILMESQPFNRLEVIEGRFDYVEKAETDFKTVIIPILPEDKALVQEQIQDTYVKVKNFAFDKGCGEPECTWCNFAKANQLALKGVHQEEE